ncbi:MAG: 50S ribosomal protein L33 [Thermodesulfovibrionales bacterium]|nr:50S ribosomal protein L33 [Thermodesulfovibrionales bacterium]
MRDIILFQCSECKNKNYSTTKNKKNNPDKLNFKKYCRSCKRHTLHKEVKS